MNLLPTVASAFAEKDYWDNFFSRNSSFEWYGEYLELCGVFHKYIRQKDRLLVVGCGNSKLSCDLYDAGFHDNTNIDISETVIKQMTEKYCSQRPTLKYCKMDVKEMSFEDGEFSVVLDKGTLDALCVDSSDSCTENVQRMMSEIHRVLKQGGRYLCVTLLQSHVFKFLLQQSGWMFRVHSLLNSALESEEIKALTVFVVVCTKMKTMPNMKQVLEFCGSETCVPERKETFESLRNSVLAAQQYAYFCHQITSRKFLSESMSVDLYGGDRPQPRYKIFILDNTKKTSLKFAVFVVPQGREVEWLFSSHEGHSQLVETVGCQRLLVVHLSRDHVYVDLEQVKEELSQRVMHYRPPGITAKDQSPFLSVEGHIGERNILHQGHSETTGDYIVEDVISDGQQRLRRLIFLSNRNVIQSEARLKPVAKSRRKRNQTRKKDNNNNSGWEVDHSFLSCDHHKHMIAGILFLPQQFIDSKVDVLIIGLGGGGLPSYIQKFLPNVVMDVVEIDSTIASIAHDWFELSVSSSLNLHIDDGIAYLKKCQESGKVYDAVMFDVNNDEASTGLSVPPPAFIQKDVLQTTSNILSPHGNFILNLVCRNEALKEEITATVKEVFKTVCFQKVPAELNQVLYATNCAHKIDLASIKYNAILLNKMLKKNSFKTDLFNIQHLMKNLHILS